MSGIKGMNHYPETIKNEIRQAYHEGQSVKALSKIYGISRIGIDDIKIIEGGRKLEVTIVNENCPTTGNILLLGGLYDADGKFVKTVAAEISNLTNGEKHAVILDFDDDDVMNYTCKLFLWDKTSLSPYCSQWKVN